MTLESDLDYEDCFIPTEFLPPGLKKIARRSPIPFPGTTNLMMYFKHLKTMDEAMGRSAVIYFYDHLKHYYEQLAIGRDTYEKGLDLLRAMDHVLKEESEQHQVTYAKVTCRRACTHCCHSRLSVTKLEMMVMRSHIKRLGIPMDLSRAKLQTKKGLNGHEALPYEDQRCLMLGEDGSCQVYEWRPLACRKYHVVSPPEMCDKRKHSHAQLLFAIRAEALTAAAYTYDSPRVDLDRNLADHLLREFPETSNLWIKNEETDRTRN